MRKLDSLINTTIQKRTTNVKIGAPNIVINAPIGSIRGMKKAGEISQSVLFKNTSQGFDDCRQN